MQRLPIFVRGAILWAFFFLVALGLGYPTLARYDPRAVGISDATQYYRIVVGSPAHAERQWRYRVLTPYVAKPFYWLAQGRVGTWNPVAFALLVTNALFTASAALLLVLLGGHVARDPATALLGAAIYLLNFVVAHAYLAGLVDAAEGFLLLLLAWMLFRRHWWALPILVVFGVMAKETYLILGVVFVATWWLVEVVSRRNRTAARGAIWGRAAWIVCMGLAGLATVVAVRWLVTTNVVSPLQVAGWARGQANYADALWDVLTDRSFWYVFGWLLPLGVLGLRRLRCAPWVLASLTAAAAALALGVYSHAEGNVARPMFSAAGPVLSLATAHLLVRLSPRPAGA